MTRREPILLCLGVVTGLCCLGAAGLSFAQSSYPSRPIRVIVPASAGSGTDNMARAMAEDFESRMRARFVIDNRGGGSMVIGAQTAARAAPDGYTLLVGSQTLFAIVPNMKARLPYDPRKDFEPISLLAFQPYLLVVHTDLGVDNVRQLVELAKAQPGKLVWGTPSPGSGGHLTTQLFLRQAGVSALVVPYKSVNTWTGDLLGGHIKVMLAPMSSIQPLITSGKTRAIAITSLQRSAAVPNVPTVTESGLRDFATSQWLALAAPRGLSKQLVDRFNAEWQTSARSDAMKARLGAQGYTAEPSTPQQLSERITSEFARFGELVKSLGLREE